MAIPHQDYKTRSETPDLIPGVAPYIFSGGGGIDAAQLDATFQQVYSLLRLLADAAGVNSGGGLNVSLQDLDNLFASRLLGRYSPTTGPVQQIAIGARLSLSGSGVLSADVQSAGGAITVVEATYSNAQVQSLNTVPQTIVPAQGAGTLVVPVYFAYWWIYGGVTPMSGNTNLGVQISGAGASSEEITNAIISNASRASHRACGALTAQVAANILNSALTVRTSGNLTGGDANNSLKVSVGYAVVDFAAIP